MNRYMTACMSSSQQKLQQVFFSENLPKKYVNKGRQGPLTRRVIQWDSLSRSIYRLFRVHEYSRITEYVNKLSHFKGGRIREEMTHNWSTMSFLKIYLHPSWKEYPVLDVWRVQLRWDCESLTYEITTRSSRKQHDTKVCQQLQGSHW